MNQGHYSNRASGNFSSNIEITDEPIKIPIKHSFQNISQIKQILNSQDNNMSSNFPEFIRKKQSLNNEKDLKLPITTNQRYQTYRCKNTITQQQKQFKIVRMQTNPNSNNQKLIHSNQYKNWLNQNKKFTKPYSEMTRYVDNLQHNKNLIRRGQFNIPLHKDSYKSRLINSQQNHTINLNNNSKQIISNSLINSNINNIMPLINDSRYKSITHSQSKVSFNMQYKPIFKTKKQISQSSNTLKIYDLNNSYKNDKQLSIRLQNTFDRSLNGCLNKYQTLIKMQRNQKEDQKTLKNSMNKIIAIQEIKDKIKIKNLYSKDNIQKIKKSKKFKNFQQKYLDQENYLYD